MMPGRFPPVTVPGFIQAGLTAGRRPRFRRPLEP